MKCPRCEAEVPTQQKCSKCGFDPAGNPEELEIEYKDFKTMELLEIRQKKQPVPSGEETKENIEQPGKNIPERKRPAASLPKPRKSSFLILAVIVLILALITGGVFLLRLLVFQK